MTCPPRGVVAVQSTYLCRNLVAKQPASASRADSPSVNFFRITPNEIAEGAFVGDLLRSRHNTDLVQRSDLGAQATVYAENFAVNDSG